MTSSWTPGKNLWYVGAISGQRSQHVEIGQTSKGVGEGWDSEA